jgi:hypothetical protein
MIIFFETLYDELEKEGRLVLPNSNTPTFYIFNLNARRALVLPTLKYGPESDPDYGLEDALFLKQIATIHIITSLEAYYQDILRLVSSQLRAADVNTGALVNFIKTNRLSTEFFQIFREKNMDFCLLELMPVHFPLQDKDKIRASMQLLGLDPVGQFGKEWNRTYGKDALATVQLRHAFVHKGSDLEKAIIVSRNSIKERIKDAVVLVCNIEEQIVKKYPKMVSLRPRPARKDA